MPAFFWFFLAEKGLCRKVLCGRGIGAWRASPLRGSPPFSGAKASRRQHPFPPRPQPPKAPGANTPARQSLPAAKVPPGISIPSRQSLRQSHLRCCPLPEVPVRPLGLCRTLTGRVTMICVEAPQARITRLACYGARLRGARQRLSSPRPLPRPIHCLSQFCQSPARLTLLRRASEAPWVRR